MKASVAFGLSLLGNVGAALNPPPPPPGVLSAEKGWPPALNSTSPSVLSSGKNRLGEWQSAYEKAASLVVGLTNDEKITIITGGSISGNNTWNALSFKDGMMGVQWQYFVSSFSVTSALAMTWDKDHFLSQAKAVGSEFYLEGYQVLNGPTSEPLGRTPWGGRLAETFTPDPYLNGIAFGEMVKGIRQSGVIAGGKHFLLNEQETNRTVSISTTTTAIYSSNADDKTIHEAYLWPFYDGVRAGLGGVMCAMNKVNGTLSCENSALLNGLLKEELGFPGLVFPDMNAQSTAVGSANGGLDYGSSTMWTTETLGAGIANGSFTQARLDDMVIRNVAPYYFAGLDDGKQPETASATDYRDVRANHAALIRKIGAESLVLLKNNNANGGGLPLNRPRTMAVFGAHAGPVMAGPNQAFSVQGVGSTYQGHMASGSGSGQDSFAYLITPFNSLTTRAVADGTMIRWVLNDTYGSSSSSMGGDSGSGGVDLSSLGQGTAVTPGIESYADNAEACLVFLNAYAGEGADRTELANAEQDALVNTVASTCNNTMVVINTVGARLVDQWIEHANVTALLYGGPLGQESGNAIADVLYGDVNPSGKLTHTIAKNESDYTVGVCYTAQCDFAEGVYIDYRSFDARNVTPRYEFGFGLSYTSFTFSDVAVTKTNASALAAPYASGPRGPGGRADLWDEMLQVSARVTNAGHRTGKVVAQLYVGFPDSAGQPLRQLRGFEKVELDKGESSEVVFGLRRRDVSVWDTGAQEWRVERGAYRVWVGGSLGDASGEGAGFVV
ncbi:glycoside hydrolase family 3 protein [Aplosporella prunicola CBS 121167]|uniref:beta-glucosidase n=1 Tax=Aplosporella prunicola CBS 121167 TaxID=1176127 RepID=A0A6A6BA59_9PEZI|nr:glycoside hydrolase family 3 protein [Aplosporella prunicola CBS 121167]KAF2141089.1 glycoside hydrolase family 3 protein [Aplosporella prunicola CBS 121167]